MQPARAALLTRRRLLAAAGTGALGITAAGFMLPRGGVQRRLDPGDGHDDAAPGRVRYQDQAARPADRPGNRATAGAADVRLRAPAGERHDDRGDHHRDQGQGAGPGTDPRDPAGRRPAARPDERRPPVAPRPVRLAHGPLAWIPQRDRAVRRRPGDVDRRSSRPHSSRTTTSPATPGRTCTTATSRTWSTCRWA